MYLYLFDSGCLNKKKKKKREKKKKQAYKLFSFLSPHVFYATPGL